MKLFAKIVILYFAMTNLSSQLWGIGLKLQIVNYSDPNFKLVTILPILVIIIYICRKMSLSKKAILLGGTAIAGFYLFNFGLELYLNPPHINYAGFYPEAEAWKYQRDILLSKLEANPPLPWIFGGLLAFFLSFLLEKVRNIEFKLADWYKHVISVLLCVLILFSFFKIYTLHIRNSGLHHAKNFTVMANKVNDDLKSCSYLILIQNQFNHEITIDSVFVRYANNNLSNPENNLAGVKAIPTANAKLRLLPGENILFTALIPKVSDLENSSEKQKESIRVNIKAKKIYFDGKLAFIQDDFEALMIGVPLYSRSN